MNIRIGLMLLALWAGSSRAGVLNDEIELTTIVPNLSAVLAVRHAGDGSGRTFLVQQGGTVRWLDSSDVLQATPFFSIGDVGNCALPGMTATALGFSSGGERGLLGLAFHPNFGLDNQFFFASFTDARGDTVVARFTASGNTTVVDSCRVVLRVDQDFSNHNGGDIQFGPDGFLYVGLGDGGSGNDPCNRAQTLNPSALNNTTGSGQDCMPDGNFSAIGLGNPNTRALLGKMLRLDVDSDTTAADAGTLCGARTGGVGTDVVAHYAIPSAGRANPFVGADPANACDEVWAYGLRNPWRFSFDRVTGDLWIGDVGQGTTEEIDFEPANATPGRNYGWDPCEGPWNTGSRSTLCGLAGAIPPVLEFSSQDGSPNNPSSRCSITGGYRYRGPIPDLRGAYIYGDYCSGEILTARDAGGGTFSAQVWSNSNVPAAFGVVGFGEDELGRVYLTRDDVVYRFELPSLIYGDGLED